ncbi:MAG: HEAT repeat domain-containing protein [Bacteroidota bacterium]
MATETDSLLWLMGEWAIKGTFLIAFVGVLTMLLKNASAALRHGVWALGMVMLLCLPLLQVVTPAMPVGWLPAPPVEAAEPAAAALEEWMPMAESPVPMSASAPEPATEADVTHALAMESATFGERARAAWQQTVGWASSLSATHWIVLIWSLGVALVLINMLSGAMSVWWLTRQARPVRDPEWCDLVDELSDRLALTRPIQLLKSPRATTPLTWGATRPVVMLPIEADTWSQERRRCVLLHELAHVKRYDCVSQTFAQMACAFNWYNPLVWLAARHMRIEREKACDDFVIRGGVAPSAYATHLLDIAKQVKRTFVSPMGAVAMAKKSQLEGRVMNVLDPKKRRNRMNKVLVGLSVLASCIIVLPLAAIEPLTNHFSEDAIALAHVEEVAAAEKAHMEEVRQRERPAREQRPMSRRAAAFVALLGDEDPTLRQQAAHSLGDIESDEVVDALLDALRKEQNAEVRQTIVWALGQIESTAAVEALMVHAEREQDAEVLNSLVHAVGQIEDERAVSGLLQMWDRMDNSSIRAQIAWALGQIESEDATQGLAKMMQLEPEAEVRTQIAWALGQIEDERAVGRLVRALEREEAAEVRAQIAWALGQIEDDRAVDGLSEALRNERNAEVRQQMVWALGQIENERAVDALVTVINRDRDREVRENAAWALGQIESERAVDSLVGLLNDSDEGLRNKAIWALAQIESEQATEALAQVLLNDRDRENRAMAAHALGQIEDARAIDALVEALKDDDAEVRRNAAWALSQIDDDDWERYDNDSDWSSASDCGQCDRAQASGRHYHYHYDGVDFEIDEEKLREYERRAEELGLQFAESGLEIGEGVLRLLEDVFEDEDIRREVKRATESAMREVDAEVTVAFREAMRELKEAQREVRRERARRDGN